MIRLIIERYRLWRSLKRFGNPYRHSFLLIMQCSIPHRMPNGYIYLFEYDDKTFEVHAALSSLTRTTAREAIALAKRLGAKRLTAYDPDPALIRIYEHCGARRDGERYILEIDHGKA